MTQEAPTKVVGIDPGLTRCGVAVLEGPTSTPVSVYHECITTDADLRLEQRLLTVHERLLGIISEHRPDAVAVERVLFSANVRTAMATGQAAGVALLAGANADVRVWSYGPTDVKLTVAGNGAADKGAVARMVTAQLRLEEASLPADVTDAMAVALTHLARSRLERLAADTPAARQLAEAHDAARGAAAGGWERVLGERAKVASAIGRPPQRRSPS